MNKITKKLFLYFSVVCLILAGTIFCGFYGIFKYYSFKHHEQELQTRAETIQERLEDFISDCAGNQELSSYIKVLDDISMADAYFISKSGESFTCSCSCNTTVVIEKLPTPEVEEFAQTVFKANDYIQINKNNKESQNVIYAGIPVVEDGETTAVVILVDTFDIDAGSYWLAISILMACILLALVIAAVFSIYMAKRFMQPIQKIANATKELANGNYQVKTDVDDKNEIGDLAKETDILAEKLDKANRESEHLKQMQKNYIANISHELRTPVTVIRSTIEALHDGMVPEENISEYQEQMLSDTIALQRLVNDMLEISRLENEEFPIEKQQLDLRYVLEDVIRSGRMVAKQKNMQIHFNGEDGEWMFEGDYGRLRQMFLTILDNAVKYSEENKNIWIDVKVKKEYYFISIRDEGYGIPEEKQSYVFDKFYRTSHEHVGGTGLGMAIAKSIADRHQIEIRLNSIVEKGTTITFIVPVYK